MNRKMHYTPKSGYFPCEAKSGCPKGNHIVEGSLIYKMGNFEHQLEVAQTSFNEGKIDITEFNKLKKQILDEGYAAISKHDEDRIKTIKMLVPRDLNNDLAKYYEQTDKKHFGSVENPGSQFTSPNVNRIEDILTVAYNQRGDLKGDDREILIQLGSDPSVFLDNFRYLYVETDGVLGIKNTSTMPDNQELKVVRTKDRAKPNLAAVVKNKDNVDYGVIILGNDEEVGREIFITAYPGLVTKKSEESSGKLEDSIGETYTVKQMRDKLGHDIWVNTYLTPEII